MRPFVWVIIGLGLNVVGALLLAIEVITVENLKRLFGTVHFLFTDIEVQLDGADKPKSSLGSKTLSALFLIWWIGVLHFGSGFLILLGCLKLAGAGITDFYEWVGWYLALLGFPLLIGICGAGEIVHQLANRLTWVPMRFLAWAEDDKNKGKVGLAGAALLVAGFVMQSWGAYAGRGS